MLVLQREWSNMFGIGYMQFHLIISSNLHPWQIWDTLETFQTLPTSIEVCFSSKTIPWFSIHMGGFKSFKMFWVLGAGQQRIEHGTQLPAKGYAIQGGHKMTQVMVPGPRMRSGVRCCVQIFIYDTHQKQKGIRPITWNLFRNSGVGVRVCVKKYIYIYIYVWMLVLICSWCACNINKLI